jgi:hypothetical protein
MVSPPTSQSTLNPIDFIGVSPLWINPLDQEDTFSPETILSFQHLPHLGEKVCEVSGAPLRNKLNIKL